MTAIELQALSYWRAGTALRNPRLSPADRAAASDMLRALAQYATTRVRAIAARRLWPHQQGGEVA